MSSSSRKKLKSRQKEPRSDEKDMPTTPLNSMGVSSSLDSIFISPRTPVARTPRNFRNGHADAEVELSLLGDDERRQAAEGLDSDDVDYTAKHPLSAKDKRAMVLLCVLCKHVIYAAAAIRIIHRSIRLLDLIQGVPVSLSSLTLPHQLIVTFSDRTCIG